MLTFLEKMIFEKFHEMPSSIRAFTYLLILLLFVYLLLLPKFIDSRVVFKDETGGEIPYRGVEVRMHLEGRDYKFTTNEHGYVSIPIVSKLPESIEIRVHNVDLDKEFPFTFNLLDIWKKGIVTLKMDKSGIGLVAENGSHTAASQLMIALNNVQLFKTSIARAGVLSLPSSSGKITPEEKKNVRNAVIAAVSAVNGVNKEFITESFPLSGANAPSYVQRIQIVGSLEKEFGLTIPDEHWKSLNSIGQLIDYIEKRQRISNSIKEQNPKIVPKNWSEIQRILPPAQRPIYSR